MLVAGNGDRVLMLHHRAAVNIERGNKDVFDMVLGAAARVLRPKPPMGAAAGSIAAWTAGE